MADLSGALLELIRLTSTDLPADVEQALHRARTSETPGSAAAGALDSILENVALAREKSSPICQDTGTPLFYVRHPAGWSTRQLREQIRQAVAAATKKAYLRPNAVDSLSGKNSGNNLGDEAFPTIHFEEADGDPLQGAPQGCADATEPGDLTVELILKGGGCENVGAQYSLPDDRLNAGRDLEGVRRVTLDAVHRAQGQGCAPGILGVAIGGDRSSSFAASKEVLLRPLDDVHPEAELAEFEARLLQEGNQLGIGPMGFGGQTTLLGVKATDLHRLPASFFVSISYMCWAYRRRRMVVHGDDVRYA
jgi:fumarate hydratase class I